jgi:hypothetical protein
MRKQTLVTMQHSSKIQERHPFRACASLLLIHSPRDIHQKTFHKRETTKSPRIVKILAIYFSQWESYAIE